jgi:hypothetical protein
MIMKLMTWTELAAMLELNGYPGVTPRQVFMWHQRRANNGFPEAACYQERRRTPVPVFDPREVRAWRVNYVPSKGGRPPGTRMAA